MRFLITGGLGFIGSNFIRYLLNKNKDARVTILDKISQGANLDNLQGIDDENYIFIKGDICDSKSIKSLIENVDAVINFAAETHVDRSIADPWPFFKSNVEGALTLLEVIRNSNKSIRFIQIGTDESYGEIKEGSFIENNMLKPSSPYSASKASADMFCIAYHNTYDLDVTVTRCTNNFGPFQFLEKFIPKVIVRAYLDLKVPIYGSGSNIRDWIYVNDHCEAICKVLEKGRAGHIYNIASGNELENIKVAENILRLMNKPKSLIEFVEDRPGHDLRYSLDSSKIRSELGWKPKYKFQEAMEETVNWYLSNEHWWKKLLDEKNIHQTPWKLHQ
ncbi:MAG: dTDP-glucose 4,6-dehydratase [Candidatus Bathyarchaeota archaeon]|nr:dTDP-glucose 4,6-dehydratase [Candidatus Bathyarchaeota archaeon]